MKSLAKASFIFALNVHTASLLAACSPHSLFKSSPNVVDAGRDASTTNDAATSSTGCQLANDACAARTEGAFICFKISGQYLVTWITNGTFINQAKQIKQTGMDSIPVFNTIIRSQDCDPKYTWHADPVDVEWATTTAEVCDGTPTDVESPNWKINYCPWDTTIESIDDRRSTN